MNDNPQRRPASRSQPGPEQGPQLEVGILGPVEARLGGKSITLGGSKQRVLLSIMLLKANHVVSTERLIELLWGDEPSESSVNYSASPCFSAAPYI